MILILHILLLMKDRVNIVGFPPLLFG